MNGPLDDAVDAVLETFRHGFDNRSQVEAILGVAFDAARKNAIPSLEALRQEHKACHAGCAIGSLWDEDLVLLADAVLGEATKEVTDGTS